MRLKRFKYVLMILTALLFSYNAVNNYSNIYCNALTHDSTFIISYSSKVKLTQDDLIGLNAWTLKIARNEIYARRGYIFKTKDMSSYFKNKSWYHPNKKFKENQLSIIEKYNIDFIKSYEKKLTVAAFNRSVDKSNDYFLIPYSSTTKLTVYDLYNFSLLDLKIARNEIYARHGYIFKTKDMKEYFENKYWYKPNPKFKTSSLNKIEVYNIKFIQSFEK